MKPMIVFALVIACVAYVSGAPSGYAHAPVAHAVAVPVVSHAKVGEISHTPIYNVQKVHHTVHPVSIPVHHPPVTSVHHEPTAVLAKAPKLSGYSYTSEVRHDAPVHAVAHAAPVHHAEIAHAPVAVAHAPAAYAAPAVHADLGHGYGHSSVVAHSPQVEVGHAPAPYVSGSSLQVAPAKIVETPAVSSYSLNTGRIDTVSQSHYGTVHTPIVQKVGYQAHSVPVAVSHHAAPVHGYGSHY